MKKSLKVKHPSVLCKPHGNQKQKPIVDAQMHKRE